MSDMGNGCRKIKPLLEAYFEGVLPAEEERTVGAHLWQCPRCAAEVEQIRRLTMTLEALPRIEPAEQLARAISFRIASLPAAAQRRNVWAGWRRLGVEAAAAIAVMTLAGYLAVPYVPALGAAFGRLWSFVGGLAMKAEVAWQALLPLGVATKSVALALLDALQVSAPTMARYAAAEAVLLVVVTVAIRHGHVRTAPVQR